jgi:hypothetical protein
MMILNRKIASNRITFCVYGIHRKRSMLSSEDSVKIIQTKRRSKKRLREKRESDPKREQKHDNENEPPRIQQWRFTDFNHKKSPLSLRRNRVHEWETSLSCEELQEPQLECSKILKHEERIVLQRVKEWTCHQESLRMISFSRFVWHRQTVQTEEDHHESCGLSFEKDPQETSLAVIILCKNVLKNVPSPVLML